VKDAMERGRNVQGEGLKQERRAQRWGEGLVPPRVIRERVSTWSEKWAGWMALGPLWLGHLLMFFSSFKIFWHYSRRTGVICGCCWAVAGLIALVAHRRWSLLDWLVCCTARLVWLS